MPDIDTKRSAIIVSLSSDIGLAMAAHWLELGHAVAGTYRTMAPALTQLREAGTTLVPCDLGDAAATDAAARALCAGVPEWDVLVLAAGQLDPIGPFADCDFDAWSQSLTVNLTGQLRILHRLLPARRRGGGEPGPCVLFFAGGGANGAPVNVSAYTLSKIALTKMTELLDAEMPDVRFAIIGPGWVRTKIHDTMLRAGEQAGDGYARTVERLASGQFTPMADVLACCDWIIESSRDVIGGRNISVAFDRWGTPDLARALQDDPNLHKLRRHGNDRLPPR